MGGFLKFLSVLSGSKEETILKARPEIAQSLRLTQISNSREKEYVFKCYLNFMSHYTDPNKVSKYSLGYILIELTDYITQNFIHEKEMLEFLQTVNRVLVHHYGFILGDDKTLVPAFERMGNELDVYFKKLL
ncbi:hypothetical protein [Virgibacillus senegalensis]|uniref:hypothetical protein n=1 Tax=Virgibacillus senegalensis TaxID=1499679 RepID=UPI00069DC8E4|nr:hypothetical protein [Virgibacillus senegalensis]